MSSPKVLILRTAGTNCDMELAKAFELAGATPVTVHLNQLIENPAQLADYQILGFPGGFSYGDDIAAGRILANRLRHRLYPALREFVQAGKPMIGICNGFQVLVKTGLLGAFDAQSDEQPPKQVCTLADNALPRFLDKWVDLEENTKSVCIWTKGVGKLPVGMAHGEGRFLADEDVLDQLEANGQIAVTYVENPNGSARNIAGICDKTGLIFGLMPHPERFIHESNHPAWKGGDFGVSGMKVFENAVEYVKANLSVAS